MKRILHISKYYYPFRGGTEQIAQDCVRALDDSYEQKVICFNHKEGDEVDIVDGIVVHRCGCFAKIASQSLSFSYGNTLKKIFDEFKPDIVFFHYPNPFVAMFLLRFIPSGCRLIVYWHLDIVKQVIIRKFFRVQNRNLIKRADRIIATSPNYMRDSYWLNMELEKCCVIPNCINEKRLVANNASIALKEKIKTENKGKIICVAVGRHTEYKGFTYLIKASKLLDERFRIFMIGEGELTEELKKEAKDDEKISFLGSVSDDVLKAYLSAMDIYCFPSITKNEAFGVSLAEAMYFEKPSVTFTIVGSGVNYVCINRENGIEVENKNVEQYAKAMVELASDEALRQKYGKNSKMRVMNNFLNCHFENKIRLLVSELI